MIRREREMLPTVGLPSAALRPIAGCLRADGYLLSDLMREWVYEADSKRRHKIDGLVDGAAWTTMHMWA